MATHHFKIGDRVTVLNTTFSGRQIVEGEATVRGLCDRDDTYFVSFGTERERFERFVAPGGALEAEAAR